MRSTDANAKVERFLFLYKTKIERINQGKKYHFSKFLKDKVDENFECWASRSLIYNSSPDFIRQQVCENKKYPPIQGF